MGNARNFFPLLATAGLLASGAAQATLFDRGGGLLYDDVLNVTWLQDANYAKTSGYDAYGLLNWADAKAWAANLVYHDSVRGADYDDWRLPFVVDTGSPGCDGAYSGTDCGHNVQTVGGSTVYSELAYMYYVNLGLKGGYSPTGAYQPDWGIFRNGTWNGVDLSSFGQTDVGLVKNLQSYQYWSGSAYAPHPADLAWVFVAGNGYQSYNTQNHKSHAWAVRDGDVAAVPEPETYAMFLAGLAVMGGALRRRVRRAA